MWLGTDSLDIHVQYHHQAFPLQGSELLCNHADHRMRWEAAKLVKQTLSLWPLTTLTQASLHGCLSRPSGSEWAERFGTSFTVPHRKRPELRGEKLSPVLGPCSQLFALVESLKQKEEETWMYELGESVSYEFLFFLVSFETKTWEFLLPGKT
ncbi:uncharacterized protein CLUP02_10794 [Colletotrichum lupini]|uniref:Uncharacterized protein n=1 Tax=Colletotrichum lupini TaxID=145971 RepID=A0A9Q8WJP2_9PEZI|nr:uncharacterized protein CLUP02_10794 [Colletotrichum lupini]UQC85297.1 hypothetical protein CLUP02_10794 [Colletotrichum lupini]